MKHTLFYLGHPAHFHLFKNVILALPADQYTVVIKSKDVLEKLLMEHGIAYINVDRASAAKRKRQHSALQLHLQEECGSWERSSGKIK
jgi:predicted glycosyltransferase